MLKGLGEGSSSGTYTSICLESGVSTGQGQVFARTR